MRIRFTLPRPQRVELTLRGPAPSCRLAGKETIRGKRGINRLGFFGRVGRKSLAPGVYVLSLTRGSSRLPVGRPLLVQVFSSKRTTLLRNARIPRCQATGLAGPNRGEAFSPSLAVLSKPFGSTSRSQPPASPNSATAARQAPTPAPPEPDHDVLGVGVDLPPLPEDGQPWQLAGLLLLIGGPVLLMLVLVVRFLRGSWNP